MRLTLPNDQLDLLRAALRRAGTKEIGGQIFGEQLAPSDFLASELTFQKRPGTFARFVVEWHSHPSFDVRPSDVDLNAMRRLVNDPNFQGRFAVLMITRLDGDHVTSGAWLFDPAAAEFAITLEQQT